MLRLSAVYAFVILVYDIFAGVASRLLWVNYASLLLPGAIVLIAMGIYAGRTVKSWHALIPMVAASVVQSTLGWYLAAHLSTSFFTAPSGLSLAVEVVSSAVVAVAVGAFGVWLGLGVAGARRGTL